MPMAGSLQASRVLAGVDLSLRDFVRERGDWNISAHAGMGSNSHPEVGACFDKAFRYVTLQACIDYSRHSSEQPVLAPGGQNAGTRSDTFGTMSGSLGVVGDIDTLIDSLRSSSKPLKKITLE